MSQLIATENVAGFIRAEANFDSVGFNQHYQVPGQSSRVLRSMRAANGGDISQLGAKRLISDPRAHQRVFYEHRAYFQPDAFDLSIPGVVGARVTVTIDPNEMQKWSDDEIEEVQKALIPKADLTDAEVENVIDEVLATVLPTLEAIAPSIAAFVNSAADGNNQIAAVLHKKADRNVDIDARTVAAGARGEQVAAMTTDDVLDLDLEDLTVLVSNTTDQAMLKNLALFQGIQMSRIRKSLAASYEPFSSAIEKARVTKVNTIDADVVNNAIHFDSILKYGGNLARIKENIKVEVVTLQNLAIGMVNDLTDGNLTEEQINTVIEGTDANAIAAINSAIVGFGVPEDQDWIAIVNNGNDDAAQESMYENIGNWREADIDEEDYLIALARFAVGAVNVRPFKSNELSGYSISEFGVTRANIVEHGLWGDSDEVRFVDDREWGALSLPKSVQMFDVCTDNVVGYTTLSTAHISFMKSGHHVTANNIGNTYVKIREAIQEGESVDIAEVPESLALGVYYGTHPADMRAIAVLLRYMSGIGQLSYAIGRRITPQGPGTVSMYLLNLIIKQLAHVNFFQFLNRDAELHQFTSLYATYAATSYLETPYAQFMYGESKAESVALKQNVAPMFAYASAIGRAMPNSTFGFSVALSRDALASANNAIVARLEVESFVRAYRTFLRGIVRSQLANRAGIASGTAQAPQLLEDAEG
jgi:hypothetical protein